MSRWIAPELAGEVAAEARAVADGQVLAAGGTPARQRFRALPARLGIYFVLGLCLHSGLPYAEVLKYLASGLRGALAAAGWQVPAATALRRRLGEAPFQLLFERLCPALSPGHQPWSHICGLLAVAWDGTTIHAPATPASHAAFAGRGGKKQGHYPQIRLVSLLACGTRGMGGASCGPLGTGERKLAAGLVGCLRAGMLLLAGRGFYSYQLWCAAAAAGADLLWRVPASMHLPVVRALPDGSWLTHIRDPAAVTARAHRNGKRRRRGSKLPPETGPLPHITVRVIEFTLTVTTDGGGTRTELYRPDLPARGHPPLIAVPAPPQPHRCRITPRHLQHHHQPPLHISPHTPQSAKTTPTTPKTAPLNSWHSLAGGHGGPSWPIPRALGDPSWPLIVASVARRGPWPMASVAHRGPWRRAGWPRGSHPRAPGALAGGLGGSQVRLGHAATKDHDDEARHPARCRRQAAGGTRHPAAPGRRPACPEISQQPVMSASAPVKIG